MLQESTGEAEGGGSGQSAGCFPDIYDGQDFKNWLDGSYIGEYFVSCVTSLVHMSIYLCQTDAHSLLLSCVLCSCFGDGFLCCVSRSLCMCLSHADSLLISGPTCCA